MRICICGGGDRELGAGEVGEVCVGASVDGPWADVYRPMLGYWNRPDETRRALRGGLLRTGDLGSLDEAGNLFIKDRKNDLIIRGGANIYPAEVERVLHDAQGVAACAVVGRPDHRLGERVVAFVQLAGGAMGDAEALVDHCRQNLACYKVPETSSSWRPSSGPRWERSARRSCATSPVNIRSGGIWHVSPEMTRSLKTRVSGRRLRCESSSTEGVHRSLPNGRWARCDEGIAGDVTHRTGIWSAS